MITLRRLLALALALSLGLTLAASVAPPAGADGAGDGTVLAFGSAPFEGSTDAQKLAAPIVTMAATPSGQGYWLVASDGGVFGFGDAGFFGSAGGLRLNRPIVGMAATPSGQGYWLVASDGGIFSYGDAPFAGSTGSLVLNRPIVGMAGTPSGQGYWLVASDGGIFNYGDAGFFGSAGSLPLKSPMTAMTRTADGAGYWLVASDGGIFSYGDAPFAGSGAGQVAPTKAVVGMAANSSGGYWLVSSLRPYGPAAVGPTVADVQRRLNDLGYWVPVSGRVDFLTVQALYALEKVAGLPRVGGIGGAERAALERGSRPSPRDLFDGIEVDKGHQIVMFIRNGTVVYIFNTSTGSGQVYFSGGQRAVAFTPEGHFHIYSQINGMRISSLGQLFRPKYFTGGFALHGSPSIPPFPASHGCVRLSNGAINFIWDSGIAPIGTPVFVYH